MLSKLSCKSGLSWVRSVEFSGVLLGGFSWVSCAAFSGDGCVHATLS